jgi:hypothetical protein
MVDTEVCRLSVCQRRNKRKYPFANGLNGLNGLAIYGLGLSYACGGKKNGGQKPKMAEVCSTSLRNGNLQSDMSSNKLKIPPNPGVIPPGNDKPWTILVFITEKIRAVDVTTKTYDVVADEAV